MTFFDHPLFDPEPTLWVEPPGGGQPCCVWQCVYGADYVVNDERNRMPRRKAVCGKHLALFTAPVGETANTMI